MLLAVSAGQAKGDRTKW